jgi:mannose-1-phosphate guanylyltransferase
MHRFVGARALSSGVREAGAPASLRRSVLYMPGSNARALDKARSLPADALIKDSVTLARQISAALKRAAATPALLTFAIKPDHAATSFGYLEMGEEAGDGFRKVKRFVEKPDGATAEGYVASGHYAWNAGMFFWSAGAFLAEAEKHTPMLAAFIREFPVDDPTAYLAAKFPTLEPKVSVDYAIMEKAAAVETMLAEFDWDDVGLWTALPKHLPRDAGHNAVRGPVVAVNAERNIAVSNGRVIALVGVSDLVVVETADSILVCHRDAVQDIKKLMPLLPKELL